MMHGNPLNHCHIMVFPDYVPSYLFYFPHFIGIPDFSEVYGFIGSVFDPNSKGHVQKLQEMDPINFETVSQLYFILANDSSLNCIRERKCTFDKQPRGGQAVSGRI